MRDLEEFAFVIWVYFNADFGLLPDETILANPVGYCALWVISYLGALYFIHVVRKYDPIP